MHIVRRLRVCMCVLYICKWPVRDRLLFIQIIPINRFTPAHFKYVTQSVRKRAYAHTHVLFVLIDAKYIHEQTSYTAENMRPRIPYLTGTCVLLDV